MKLLLKVNAAKLINSNISTSGYSTNARLSVLTSLTSSIQLRSSSLIFESGQRKQVALALFNENGNNRPISVNKWLAKCPHWHVSSRKDIGACKQGADLRQFPRCGETRHLVDLHRGELQNPSLKKNKKKPTTITTVKQLVSRNGTHVLSLIQPVRDRLTVVDCYWCELVRGAERLVQVVFVLLAAASANFGRKNSNRHGWILLSIQRLAAEFEIEVGKRSG